MTQPNSFVPSRRQIIAASAAAALAAPGAARAMGGRQKGSATPTSAGATFVLVHGAWHGGWCWQRVVDRLTAKGHRVFAPTLSGVCERSHLASESINLTTHINDVVNEIKWKDLDHVVLCGHSYGGMVITGVAEQVGPKIASIVYLDAFIPADGQSLADVNPVPSGNQPMAERAAFTKPIATAERFAVNVADRAWVDSKMTPQSTATFTEKLKVTGAYQQIAKKTYVRAKQFSVPAFDAALAAAQKDPTWKTHVVDCGHDVMIDKPDELTELLIAAI